ncbi:MAG: immunoglobulin domain-containing protein [Verrucomicrobia bacterium]|nr:immunoglobulin domain-containing protein [Verrucomicrobiota bacterium]
MINHLRFLAFAVSFLVLRSAAATYLLTDLGPGSAVAINASGMVARNDQGKLYLHQGTDVTQIQVINPLGGDNFFPTTSATDLNDTGVLVGSVVGFVPSYYGVFSSDGINQSVMAGPPSFPIAVYRINNAGWVVGNGDPLSGSPTRPFSGPKVLQSQFTPFNQGHGAFLGLNEAGIEVGYFSTNHNIPEFRFTDYRARAVKVVEGVVTFIDTRSPGDAPIYNIGDPTTRLSEAYGINSSGVIVGRMALVPDGPKHAFRYLGNGLEDLGTLGGTASEALDVNASGQIVGNAQTASGQWRPFLYQEGVLTDLNSLLPVGSSTTLVRVYQINDAGAMVGEAVINGATHGFVLTPDNLATPPSIQEQPQGVTVALGAKVTLSVSAIGTQPLSFQWEKNSVPLEGKTAATLVIEKANGFDAGKYRVVVTNSAGKVISTPAVVTVLDPKLVPYALASLSIYGEVGATYVIEAKPAVGDANWEAIATRTLTNSPEWYVDFSSATNVMRIYRSVRVP